MKNKSDKKVYWITGLSGAGKTTIGKLFFEKFQQKNPNSVFLDGDTLREVFGNDLGYSEQERRICAMRYSRICKMLSEQDINVVICTISMYDDIREWNRNNIPGYFEVYIKVPEDVLYQRNQKNLYQEFKKGVRNDVVGAKGDFEEPKFPDIIIENTGDVPAESLAEELYGRVIEV